MEEGTLGGGATLHYTHSLSAPSFIATAGWSTSPSNNQAAIIRQSEDAVHVPVVQKKVNTETEERERERRSDIDCGE